MQFFAVGAPASTVKRAVDQPPEPMLELRCDAHRCVGGGGGVGCGDDDNGPRQSSIARNAILIFANFRAGITAATWHVDATFFASADANGTVVLWKRKVESKQHRRRPSFDGGGGKRT